MQGICQFFSYCKGFIALLFILIYVIIESVVDNENFIACAIDGKVEVATRYCSNWIKEGNSYVCHLRFRSFRFDFDPMKHENTCKTDLSLDVMTLLLCTCCIGLCISVILIKNALL